MIVMMVTVVLKNRICGKKVMTSKQKHTHTHRQVLY